jgi:hypothetical protein
MADIARKFIRRPSLKDNHPGLRKLFLWFCLLLLFAFVSGSTAKGADVQNRPVTSVGPSAQFAIADFDGDLRPDLASVQAGTGDGSRSIYWIQLQLSAAGRQNIRVVAPFGGLLIAAGDVNGDHALDLVLTTAWLKQPVAILLNDGHGNFSPVDPAAYPWTFGESETNWASAVEQVREAVATPPQSRAGDGPEADSFPHFQSLVRSIPPPGLGSFLSPFLMSHPGRAPPSEVTAL